MYGPIAVPSTSPEKKPACSPAISRPSQNTVNSEASAKSESGKRAENSDTPKIEPGQHLSPDLRVLRIRIIHHPRRSQSGNIDQRPEKKNSGEIPVGVRRI